MNRRLRAAAALAAALGVPALPAWALATALHPRWRRDWAGRWGVEVAPIAPGCVWVHAASVGEVRVVEALLPGLPRPVLITADTDTGAERARAVAAAAGQDVVAAIRPVDHPLALAPLWAEARPRAVVLVENAWWPQLVARAARAGVPVVRAGARPGPGSRRASVLWRLVGQGVDAVAAVDAQGAALHGPWRPVAMTGDPKRDVALAPGGLSWPGPFVVAASTRPGDEEAVLDAWIGLRPRPALLLAPRHLDRVPEVERLALGRGLSVARRTALPGGRVPPDVDVVVLDTLGELAALLPGARAAFVGGTLDPRIGGHSPAEALAAGVPVVAGPHVQGQPSLADPGVRVVPREGLRQALSEAIDGERVPSGATGAAQATLELLSPWLAGPPAPEAAPRPWARPLVPAWAAGAALRAAVGRARRGERLPVPVWSVGSPSARGPGRTSTVRWLADALAARGHRVGVAVPGYRRAGHGLGRSWVSPSAADLGDEGALCARDGHLVAAGDRVQAARALVEAGATAIVLDDALQDRRLRRDVDLVVVDARRPRAAGLLPAGERRSLRALPRADGIVVHHASEPGAEPIPGGVEAHRLVGPWHRGDDPVDPPARVAAVVGVARPADALASLGVPVARWRVLPDHAPIDEALARELFAWADGLPLACTAKDAVRLPGAWRDRVAWRDLRVRIDDPPAAWFAPA